MTLLNSPSLVCAILFAAASLPSVFVVRADDDPPLATAENEIFEEVRTLEFDQVRLTGPGMQEYSTRVSEGDAVSLQLNLTGTALRVGDSVCIRSILDGAQECLGADALEARNGQSASFNGHSVEVALTRLGAVGQPSILNISSVTVGLDPIVAETICGSIDDRVQSFKLNQGRCGGCTCWLIAESHALTAGHCVNGVGSSTRMDFNVPRSTSSGGLRYPGPEHQYPGTVLARLSSGVGADWAVIELSANSETGLTAGEAQSVMTGWTDYYTLGNPATMAGSTTIDITGYGTSSDNELTQVQKTHDGTLYVVFETSLRYRTDTTGGNSGSPVVDEDASAIEGRPVAVGIHTHGGCSSTGTTSSNAGTRIDRTDLKEFVAGLNLPSPSPTPTTTAPPPPPTTTALPPTPAATTPPPPPTTAPPPPPTPTCRGQGVRCKVKNCEEQGACCCEGLSCNGRGWSTCQLN